MSKMSDLDIERANAESCDWDAQATFDASDQLRSHDDVFKKATQISYAVWAEQSAAWPSFSGINMRWLLLLIVCMMVGCAAPPLTQPTTTVNGYIVGLAFIHDGVRVYRFSTEHGNFHYFAVPLNGVSASVSSIENCGRNCHYTDIIQTAGN